MRACATLSRWMPAAVLVCSLGLSAGLTTPPGVAATLPPAGKVDARVRTVAYNPDDVVTLHGYVGYQIHLQFAEGEEFVNLGSGDNAAFDVGAERNHFFIKPKEARASTNFTVLTNRRAYHFDYVVSATAPTGAAAKRMVYSIRFTYPEDDARAMAGGAPPPPTKPWELRPAPDIANRIAVETDIGTTNNAAAQNAGNTAPRYFLVMKSLTCGLVSAAASLSTRGSLRLSGRATRKFTYGRVPPIARPAQRRCRRTGPLT